MEWIKFQFPLHRDPRCNKVRKKDKNYTINVSVPFTSGSSLQLPGTKRPTLLKPFQFPLHRDPRCNMFCWYSLQIAKEVSVPFTSGSSLQLEMRSRPAPAPPAFQFPLHRDPRCNLVATGVLENDGWRFSSLYIGILAATCHKAEYNW